MEVDPSWDCAACNALVKHILARDRPARLTEAIADGVKTKGKSEDCPGEVIVECRICPAEDVAMARSYLETPPAAIVICTNGLARKDVEEVVVHELVHAYDFCVQGADLSACYALAASEVRAAREAECFYGPALSKTDWLECIRERATRSTENLKPDTGAKCVEIMFEKAMKDVAPLNTPPVKGVWSAAWDYMRGK